MREMMKENMRDRLPIIKVIQAKTKKKNKTLKHKRFFNKYHNARILKSIK